MKWSLADLTEERLFLYSLVRLYKPDTIIEIGVSEGESTCALAMALRDNGKGKMVSVDNWSRRHGGHATDARKATARLIANGISDQVVEFVTSDSQDFLKAQARDSADIVWIDADHGYEGAKADTLQAIRIAKKLAIVHDTTNLPEVGEACQHIQNYISGMSMFVRPSRGFWLYVPEGAK